MESSAWWTPRYDQSWWSIDDVSVKVYGSVSAPSRKASVEKIRSVLD